MNAVTRESVIIINFDIVSIAAFPDKADAPLIVDANAVLAGALSFQCFKTISGWQAELSKFIHGMKLDQLAQCHPLDRGRDASALPQVKKLFGIAVRERLNHMAIVTPLVTTLKRLLVSV